MVFEELLEGWYLLYEGIARLGDEYSDSDGHSVDKYLRDTVLTASFPREEFLAAYARRMAARVVTWTARENGSGECWVEESHEVGEADARVVSLLHHKSHYWALLPVDGGAAEFEEAKKQCDECDAQRLRAEVAERERDEALAAAAKAEKQCDEALAEEESPQASDAEVFLDWLGETEAEWDAERAAAAAAAVAGGVVDDTDTDTDTEMTPGESPPDTPEPKRTRTDRQG